MYKCCVVIFYTILLLSSKAGYSQSVETTAGTTNLFKVNFFFPGISYEQHLAKYSTIDLASYVDFLINKRNENGIDVTHLFFTPSFNAGYRYYYNMKRREGKGLLTAGNSSNYIAPLYIFRYTKTDFSTDSYLLNQVAFVWGWQRSSPLGFSVDLRLGMVYSFNANHVDFYAPLQPLAQISLGFRIGKK